MVEEIEVTAAMVEAGDWALRIEGGCCEMDKTVVFTAIFRAMMDARKGQP